MAVFEIAGKKVFVAGHAGMVGSAITRRLATEDCEVLTAGKSSLDLRDQTAVSRWIKTYKPDVVYLVAGKVGGIHANNSYPADFIYDNIAIAANLIKSSYDNNVQKLLYLGSSCIYPKFSNQPITEDQLLTGPLEPTNEWYAVAKIAGVKLCQAFRKQHGADFIAAMPTNLLGPGDNYDPLNSHVPAALIRRFHEAKISKAPTVTVWGTGTPRREFLAVDDLADACILLMKNYSEQEIINIGTGNDLSISDFAKLVKEVVGYEGNLEFDTSRPDGSPRKLLDVSKLFNLGWSPKIELKDALIESYVDFKRRYA